MSGINCQHPLIANKYSKFEVSRISGLVSIEAESLTAVVKISQIRDGVQILASGKRSHHRHHDAILIVVDLLTYFCFSNIVKVIALRFTPIETLL